MQAIARVLLLLAIAGISTASQVVAAEVEDCQQYSDGPGDDLSLIQKKIEVSLHGNSDFDTAVTKMHAISDRSILDDDQVQAEPEVVLSGEDSEDRELLERLKVDPELEKVHQLYDQEWKEVTKEEEELEHEDETEGKKGVAFDPTFGITSWKASDILDPLVALVHWVLSLIFGVLMAIFNFFKAILFDWWFDMLVGGDSTKTPYNAPTYGYGGVGYPGFPFPGAPKEAEHVTPQPGSKGKPRTWVWPWSSYHYRNHSDEDNLVASWDSYIVYSLMTWLIWVVASMLVWIHAYPAEPRWLHNAKDPRETFKHGHFKCFEVPSICLCAFLCPGVQWASSMHLAGFLKIYIGIGLFFACALMNGLTFGGFIMQGVFTSTLLIIYRQRLREKLGIKSWTATNCFFDCLYVCCCTCCAISQESLVVRYAYQQSGKIPTDPLPGKFEDAAYSGDVPAERSGYD
jgi:Cys-rich protein (TIGR01571 family)